MEYIESSEELMNRIANMNRDNSVLQFSLPGKGKFTLVLQEEEEDEVSIKSEVEKNPRLKQMIEESKNEYKLGKGMSTSELLNSLSTKDFE